MPKALRYFLVAAAFFVVFSVASLAIAAHTYRATFYPGIQIGSVPVGGTAYLEGERRVKSTIAHYQQQKVVVAIPDTSKPKDPATDQYPLIEVPTTAEGAGAQFSPDAALSSAWSVGHTKNLATWLQSGASDFVRGRDIDLAYSVDPKKLSEFVHGSVLPKLQTPVPAKIVVDGTSVKISDPQPGLELDETQLSQLMTASLQEVADNQSVYIKAPVKSVDSPVTVATVKPLADRLDTLGNVKISLTTTGVSLVPKREQILSWFVPVQDDNGALTLSLQKDAVAKYIATSTVVDQDKSLQQVLQSLTPLTADASTAVPKIITASLVLKPLPTVQAGSYTLSRFPGKYIEVNLAEQKLYRITGDNLEKVYRISSGKASTPTPTGSYILNGHNKRAYSYMYGLYMPYWINFLGGEYGVHELPEWPNGYKEGVGHLGVPVSDGCIRLGIGDAEEIYNWVPDGTPIYIH